MAEVEVIDSHVTQVLYISAELSIQSEVTHRYNDAGDGLATTV
jgi:hypothetical protein